LKIVIMMKCFITEEEKCTEARPPFSEGEGNKGRG
jgi:hypothetical protein